jgi:hypothetical protein
MSRALEIGEPGPELERAWAAGFFDGEGYVGYTFRSNGTKRYRRIDVQVTQIDPEVLERFRKAVGTGRVYGPYHSARRINPMWKYGIGSVEGVMHVLEVLRPYLCSIKTKQAEEAIRSFQEWGESNR